MTENSPTQATPDSEVFVSYASQDAAVANAIVDALEKHGLRCWIAPRDVRAGAQYADAIVRAISGAKALVLVLSANAIASSHVGKEIERASSKKRRIIALRIDSAPLTPALEYFLSESQWIEAQTGKMDAAYAELMDAIREPDRTALTNTPAVTPEPSATTAPAGHPKSRRNRILLAAGVAVVAVTIAALGAAKFWPAKQITAEPPTTAAATAVSDKSIAVLPFVNMSSDKEQEYFSDGLSEELLNLLAKVPELRVAARTSSFYFKGKDVKLTEVARELQVATILEGSVRKSGNRVRITTQLIRASDGYHQWSETYDRTLDDIFAVQEEIAAAVVSQLKIILLGATPTVRKTRPEAYTLYLQAEQLSRQVEWPCAECIALYQKTLAIDPNYTPALIGLAWHFAGEANWGFRPLAAGMDEARAFVSKALVFDPEYAPAHALLGYIAQQYDQDLAAAAAHFKQALALDPRDIDILVNASYFSGTLNRLDSLVPLGDYLVSRDPLDAQTHMLLAYIDLDAGRLEESITSSRTALKLSPGMSVLHTWIGAAQMLMGDYRAAVTEYEKDPLEATRLTGLAMAYHAMGNASKSDSALAELIEKHEDWAYAIASVFAYQGKSDQAFKWLDKAVVNRDSSLNSLPGDPFLRNLHNDSRWLPFLKKLGKSPEQLAAIKFELKVPQ